jgi:hypothetical protein
LFIPAEHVLIRKDETENRLTHDFPVVLWPSCGIDGAVKCLPTYLNWTNAVLVGCSASSQDIRWEVDDKKSITLVPTADIAEGRAGNDELSKKPVY